MDSRWLFAALWLFGVAAQAQTRGAVTIRGHISEMASLRFYSHQTVGEGVTGANQGQDSALNYSLDLGDVGVVPGRNNGVRGGEVRMILRANTSYVLTASVSSTGFKAGRGEMQLSDIGFGIPSAEIMPSGERAKSEGTEVLNPQKYDSDPLSPSFSNGEPEYAATLADLSTGEVPVLKGSRISYGGSLNTPNNGLLVSTRYAVHPQFFRQNSGFEATVTYTISTP